MNLLEEHLNNNNLRFLPNHYETTYKLLNILQNIYESPNLKNNLVLKGGSAVECHLENIERLFLDIDFDYLINNINNFNDEREELQHNLLYLMNDLGYEFLSPKSRHSYSLDSFKFPYTKINGNLDYTKLEINYSNSNHLFPYVSKRWENKEFDLDTEVLVISLEELLGMKIKCLLERQSAKDLYDIKNLLTKFKDIDLNLTHKSYIFYYAISSQIDIDNSLNNLCNLKRKDIIGKLLPLLPRKNNFDLEQTKKETLPFINEIIIPTPIEKEFIENFIYGEYNPELLFNDEEIIQRAKNNSFANYKVKCKKKFLNKTH